MLQFIYSFDQDSVTWYKSFHTYLQNKEPIL